jgi:hypothetical protein
VAGGVGERSFCAFLSASLIRLIMRLVD